MATFDKIIDEIKNIYPIYTDRTPNDFEQYLTDHEISDFSHYYSHIRDQELKLINQYNKIASNRLSAQVRNEEYKCQCPRYYCCNKIDLDRCSICKIDGMTKYSESKFHSTIEKIKISKKISEQQKIEILRELDNNDKS